MEGEKNKDKEDGLEHGTVDGNECRVSSWIGENEDERIRCRGWESGGGGKIS